jgi:LPS sulfotransferase NodH
MTSVEATTLPPKLRSMRFELGKFSLKCHQLIHQARLLRHWWLRPSLPYQPILVIASARTGSSLLVDYINRIPGVQSYWEVLCNLVPEGPRKSRLPPAVAIRHIERSLHALEAPIRGCKLLLHQLDNCGLTINDLDTAFPTARYIVLYRESIAEQFVSFKAAMATRQWVLFDEKESKAARITINPHELIEFCNMVRRHYAELFSNATIRQRGTVLSYEELTSDPAACLRERICPLLEATAIEPATVLRKQNTQSLEDRVANFSQIAALLSSDLCRQKPSLASS